MALQTTAGPELLFQDYRPLALKVARRFRGKAPGWVDVEDLRQECKIALLRAAEGYNPDRGRPFAAYAAVVIARAARAFIRRECRQGFSGLGRTAPDLRVRSHPYDAAALAELLPDAAGAPGLWKQERWDEILRCLTLRERQVVERRLFHDATNRDIGAALGICASRVHFLWQSAIRRIKDCVGDFSDRP